MTTSKTNAENTTARTRATSRKITKAERVQKEHERQQAEYEARQAKAAEERAAILSQFADKIEEYKILFQDTAIAAVNAMLATYKPKTTEGIDAFRIQFVCTGGSFGFRVHDYCNNSIDLSVLSEAGFTDMDVAEINHSTSGARSLDQITDFAIALSDMAALGDLLRLKIEPVACIYRSSAAEAEDGRAGTEYDYRVLNAAASAVRPVVCDYIKMRRL